MTRSLRSIAFEGLAFIAACHFAAPAQAQQRAFDLPEQEAIKSIPEFARQAGVRISAPSAELKGMRTPAIKGELTPPQALDQLLKDTGLTYEYLDANTIAIRAKPVAGVGGSPTALRLAQADVAAANAEPSGEEDSLVLDEVTVLGSRSRFRVQHSAAATKIDMPLRDTPQSLTIISDELMRTLAIRNTADAADFVPGLQESGNVNGTEVTLVSRGFEVNRDRGYKINGLVTNAELDLDYAALERLEVVRGPAAVIYGEVDYGATLNRVLKRPTSDFQAITALEFGSFDSQRVELDVGGPLSADGRLRARVVGAYQDADTQIEFTGTRQVLVAPSLEWSPTESTRIALQAYYQTVEGNYSEGFGALGNVILPEVAREAYLGADFNRIDTRNRFVTLGFDQALPARFRLSVKAAYSNVELDNINSFAQGFDLAGNAPLYTFPEPKDKRDRSFDVTLSRPFELGGREHTLALSVDQLNKRKVDSGSDFFQVGTVNLFDPQPIVTTPAQRAALYNPDYLYITELELSGVSLLALLKPTERLHLVGGLRYTKSKSNDFFADIYTEAEADDTIGRLGVVYRLTDTWSSYASWSEGIIFNAGMKDVQRRNIDPERGEQIELGVKADLFDERASFAVALFRIERSDSATYIGLQPNPPFESIYANIGRQDHQGIEVELLGEVLPGLDVLASWQYLDVDVKEAEDPATIGQRPPDSPRQSVSIFVNHAVQAPALRGLAVGAGVVHRSEREADAIGTLQLPSYTRFDLRASYDVSDHLFAEIGVKNVTDEDIYVSTFDAADNGILYVDPRSYSLRLTYKF